MGVGAMAAGGMGLAGARGCMWARGSSGAWYWREWGGIERQALEVKSAGFLRDW